LILLDTNVVSAMMMPRYEPVIDAFCKKYPILDLYLPSLVMAEIRYGIGRLPAGRRRVDIEQNFEIFLSAGFSSRIISFDDDSAQGYATARNVREQAGRPVEVEDAMIGGMALTYGATLATRNIQDFDGYGLNLVNPWA